MNRLLGLVGAPSSAGAYAPGQEKAPEAFRRHGLIDALAHAGIKVHDRGDVAGFRWRPDACRPKAMNLDAVERTAKALADKLADAFAAGERVLVLGGDCTIELGTVAGALRDKLTVGLIYIDLDVDLNPPEESDGALDWTGVAHLLDLPGTAPELSGLGITRPMLKPSDILFFASDNVTAGEGKTIAELALRQIPLAQVKADPLAAAREAAAWAARYQRVLIHVDFDVLAFTDFPIAENTRRCDGLRFEELSLILSCLMTSPNCSALTVTEINPDHAPDEALAFQQLIKLLLNALAAL